MEEGLEDQEDQLRHLMLQSIIDQDGPFEAWECPIRIKADVVWEKHTRVARFGRPTWECTSPLFYICECSYQVLPSTVNCDVRVISE